MVVTRGSNESIDIVDSLIEASPSLIRQHRALLAAIDWSKASSLQVERLTDRLAGAGMPMPGWLARDLLQAGHALPPEALEGMAADLEVLSRLNAATLEQDGPGDADLVRDAHTSARRTADPHTISALVRQLARLGAPDDACRIALAAWPNTTHALRAVRRLLPAYIATLPELVVRVSGYATTSTFAEALQPAFAARGHRVAADEAPYASAIAELHAPAADTDALFVLLDPRAFGDPDWRAGLDPRARQAAARLEALAEAIPAFVREAGRMLVINTLPAAACPSMGHMDTFHVAGRAAMTRRVNAVLADLAATHANVALVDTDLALAGLAVGERHDPRLWYYGRIGYTEAAMNALADAFARAVAARMTLPIKVVALDFDNTIWGGVYGDDGVERLACGDDPPGNAFKALQEECLRLKAQGKLLVALSKNNPDAIGVLDSHPGMLLRSDDFAATAIDWNPKANNIRRLARELNLGLDSFMFLDDSPHEREAMRRLCPEVRVPEMPADPAMRPGWLRMLHETWPVRLTHEDAERPALYLAERKSRDLKASAASYEDYLRGLGQHLTIEPMSVRTLPRVAQLHERTNQFNPTTRRFTEAELSRFSADPKHALVLLGAASDHFGNHGIVIAAVVSLEGSTARIESLVMSCRVIARQIETAFLGALLSHLLARGIREVVASYTATAKNDLVRDLYPNHGFQPLATSDNQTQHWRWSGPLADIPSTPFVTVEWSTP